MPNVIKLLSKKTNCARTTENDRAQTLKTDIDIFFLIINTVIIVAVVVAGTERQCTGITGTHGKHTDPLAARRCFGTSRRGGDGMVGASAVRRQAEGKGQGGRA